MEQRSYKHEYVLANGLRKVPLVWKGNSLAFTFNTKVLEVNYLVKLTTELEEIAKERGDWILEDGTPVTITRDASGFQQSTASFVQENYPYRTTLVKKEDGSWWCVEYAVAREEWRHGGFGEGITTPTTVISIFHQHAVRAQGAADDLPPLEEVDPPQVGQGLEEAAEGQRRAEGVRGDANPASPESQRRAEGVRGNANPASPEGIVEETQEADEIAREVPVGALGDEVGPGYVIVNGKRIEENSSLAQMREACQFLNVGKSGGKKTVFERLRNFAIKGHARMEADVVHQEQMAEKREPVQGSPLPVVPSEEEQQRHRLTHIPFEDWCELCVATRSRDSERHERREAPVATLAFDYMHTSTSAGHQSEADMLKHLVGVDSWTKALLCVPIPGKGGLSLRRCVSAVAAFARDHENVILKGDGEPSMKQLIEAVSGCENNVEVENNGGVHPTRPTSSQSS